MNIMGLGYVGVESPNHKVWEEIGPEVYGMGLADPDGDEAVLLRLDDRHHRLAIHRGDRNRLAYVGWEMPSDNEFHLAVEELERAGVVVTSARNDELAARHVHAMASFHEPGGGLRFEIFYGQEEKHRSFRPGRRMSGFVTGDQGMGHVALVTPLAPEFLTDVMGFRLTDMVVISPDRTGYFYRLNRRHHTVVLGRGSSTPAVRGLGHLMIQVGELDDVGIALDRATRRDDLPLTLTLGRHSTDRMVSFYVRTPGGFDLECGWDGLKLDEEHWTVTKTQFPAEVWGHEYLTLPHGYERSVCLEPVPA